jgi:hypothetical protein
VGQSVTTCLHATEDVIQSPLVQTSKKGRSRKSHCLLSVLALTKRCDLCAHRHCRPTVMVRP